MSLHTVARGTHKVEEVNRVVMGLLFSRKDSLLRIQVQGIQLTKQKKKNQKEMSSGTSLWIIHNLMIQTGM